MVIALPFSQIDFLAFVAVLIRISVLIAIIPFLGDRSVPSTVKILLSLSLSVALYPALRARGWILLENEASWGGNAWASLQVFGLETLLSLILGFIARFAFDAISFGGNLVGNFMGYSTASMYDPHQETQSQMIAQFQSAIAMLLFLSIDGHHLMLKGLVESFKIIGLGKAQITAVFEQSLVGWTTQVIRVGIYLAAPVAVSIFAVNIVFALVSKALPQMNVLVLSFAVTAIVGFAVLFISMGQFGGLSSEIMSRNFDWMMDALQSLKSG